MAVVKKCLCNLYYYYYYYYYYVSLRIQRHCSCSPMVSREFMKCWCLTKMVTDRGSSTVQCLLVSAAVVRCCIVDITSRWTEDWSVGFCAQPHQCNDTHTQQSKGRFPLPEFTARVNSGAFFDTRQLGPSTRVVETDLYDRPHRWTLSIHPVQHHPTMSFSDRRRRRSDSSEGRRVEGKYILWGVIGAEISRPDAVSVVNQS